MRSVEESTDLYLSEQDRSAYAFHPLRGDERVALFFAHPAPHAIRLMSSEGILAAGLQDRALGADALRCFGTTAARPASFTFRMEELGRIHVSAQPVELPFPIR